MTEKELKIKERKRNWYLKNKEKISAKTKIRYQENKEQKKAYDKEYRKNNKEKKKAKGKEYYQKNKEHIKKINNEYVLKNKEKTALRKKEWAEKNKVVIKNRLKKYREENRENLNKKQIERIEKDPIFSIATKLRKSILKSFRERAFEKRGKTVEILGCSFEEFKEHIESLFEPWMTWENRGKYNGELNYGWDIDRIIPLCTANSIEDIIKLNHYTNLRPLCSYTNRVSKRGRV